MVGAIPDVYGWRGGPVPLATYFAMARGAQGTAPEATCGHVHGHDAGQGVPAQEMTKWFDTNYHYMVPELTRDQKFALASLEECSGELIGGDEAIAALRDDHEAAARDLRKAVDSTDEAGDAGTADFLTELLQNHEEAAWMLRSFLE